MPRSRPGSSPCSSKILGNCEDKCISCILPNLPKISVPLFQKLRGMSIAQKWNALLSECGDCLPRELRPFQVTFMGYLMWIYLYFCKVDTYNLVAGGRSVLSCVPTGVGKTLMQLLISRLMGGM